MPKQEIDWIRNEKKKPSPFGSITLLMHYRYFLQIRRENPSLHWVTDSEYRKVMRAFWDKVGDILLHQPNGVVLDGLGYIAFPAYSKKSRNPWTRKLDLTKQGLVFTPQFFGTIFNNFWLRGLTIKLSRKVSRQWWHLIADGAQYKFHYSTIKKLVGAKRKHAYSGSK